MIQVDLYNAGGSIIGKAELPEAMFGQKWNPDLVHQVLVALESNARRPLAHAKGRGEVRGGGKKPWKQKGTGQARHGSIRSPLWVGGGVAHGPKKEKIYARKLNQKMKNKALATMLSQKLRDEEIIFLDKISLDKPKTKFAIEVLASLGKKEFMYKKGRRVLLALPTRDDAIEKSFRNIPVAHIDEVRNLNPLSVMTYKYLILVDGQKCVDVLAKRM